MWKSNSAGIEDQETIEEESEFLRWFAGLDVHCKVLSICLFSPLESAFGLHWVNNVINYHLLHRHCLSLSSLIFLQIVHLLIFHSTGIVISRFMWHGELGKWVVRGNNIMDSSDWRWFLTVTSFWTNDIWNWLHCWRKLTCLSLVQLLPAMHVHVWSVHHLFLLTRLRKWSHIISQLLWVLSTSKPAVLWHWNRILSDWTLH